MDLWASMDLKPHTPTTGNDLLAQQQSQGLEPPTPVQPTETPPPSPPTIFNHKWRGGRGKWGGRRKKRERNYSIWDCKRLTWFLLSLHHIFWLVANKNLSKPKVRDFGFEFTVQQNILWFQIPMNNPLGLIFMDVLQTSSNAIDDHKKIQLTVFLHICQREQRSVNKMQALHTNGSFIHKSYSLCLFTCHIFLNPNFHHWSSW